MPNTPPGWENKILHASANVAGTRVFGSDAPPGQYSTPAGFSVSLNAADPAECDRLFAALAEGGSITMPIQKTFWTERFGMLVDRFGIPWMVNCDPNA